MHHARSARRQNDIRLMHQFARQLKARVFDAADDAFRCARLDSRFVDDASGFRGAFLGARMRADEDGVAGLQAQQCLEDGGRRRLVVGMTAATRPIGSAIFLMPNASSCSMTPTVFVLR